MQSDAAEVAIIVSPSNDVVVTRLKRPALASTTPTFTLLSSGRPETRAVQAPRTKAHFKPAGRYLQFKDCHPIDRFRSQLTKVLLRVLSRDCRMHRNVRKNIQAKGISDGNLEGGIRGWNEGGG